MTELGTALRELADRQRPVVGEDAAALWRRGRARVVHRRLLGGAAAAVLALVVGAIGVTGPEPRLISPAAEPHDPGIPNRIEDPPGWLPVAEYGTRVGPLSVLGRGMRHGRMELFGIDAKTGRYRFLANGDAQVPDTPVALSPSGRYVAYWVGSDGTVTGLNVVDTVTGTESGLSGGDSRYGLVPGPLTWLNDDTVLLQFDEKADPADDTLGAKATIETFRPAGEGPRLHTDVLAGSWSRGRDGSLIAQEVPNLSSPTANFYRVYDRRLGDSGVFSLPSGQFTTVTTTSGSRVVAAGTLSSEPLVGGLLVGTLDDVNKVRSMREVGDLHVGTLLGWTSRTTVLVTGWQGDPEGQASMFEADVASGEVRRIGNAGDDVDVVLAVASDLLEKPMVEANPPQGIDPRVVRFALVGGAVLASFGLLVWRRRARP